MRFGHVIAFLAIIALLGTLALTFLCKTAEAETVVHGVTIPTVDHGPSPVLQVCTPTGSWSRGSGHPGLATASGVAICSPKTEGGPRSSTIPQFVIEAATLIESSVTFDHDSFTMSNDALASIRVVTAWMATEPKARLVIAGHTDATGTEEYNKALSENRARAVAVFLSEHDVDGERIDVEWYGESMLLINTFKRDRSNRRVVIIPVVE